MSGEALRSDDAWARIEPLMPSSDGQRGRPFRDHRQVIEGIIYRFRTGIAWRDLPASFGPHQTVSKRHRRFSADGTWDKILARLIARADAAGQVDWTVSVDSTINRAHQHATTLARADRGGRNFLYGVPEVGATALATTGPIEVRVVGTDIAEMDLSGARVRDICAEIA